MIRVEGIKFTDRQMLLLLLLQIHKNKFISHDLVSRILRRHVSAVSRDYDHFRKHKITKFNFQHNYKISKKGLDLIESLKIRVSIYNELCDFVKDLNDHPEEPGWTPKKSDNLTNLQHQIFYLFEKGISLNNAKIAEILAKHQESTIRAVKPLLKEGLLKKNLFTRKYSLTPNGNELIKNNVSTDTLCKIVQDFGKNLKKRPGINYSVIIAGLGYAGLEISKSAYATSAMPMTSYVASASTTSPVGSSTALTTATSTSILATKPILASIVAAILVTGGMTSSYMMDPTLFGNETSDDISTVNENDISLSLSQKTSTAESNSNPSDTGPSSVSAQSSTISSDVSVTPAVKALSQENNPESTQSDTSSFGSASDTSSAVSTASAPAAPSSPSIQSITTFTDNLGSESTRDVKIDKLDNRWFVDYDNNLVGKTNAQGETILVVGTPPSTDEIIPTSFTDIIPQSIQLFVLPFAHADNGDGDNNSDNSIILNKPTRLAIDNSPSGDMVHVYIVDSGNKRILKIDGNGNLIPEFRFDCNVGVDKAPEICQNTNPNNFDLRIASSSDGDSLYVIAENSSIDDKSALLHTLNSTHGALLSTEDTNLNLSQSVTRDRYVYLLHDAVAQIIKFNSNGSITIPLKDANNNALLPFSFTVDQEEQFIYVFDLFGTLHQYDTNGNFIDSKEFDGFITAMDVDSAGNIIAADVLNEKIVTISFEDALESFTKTFDKISCDTNSIIHNPITVPPEIAAALSPISELTSKANTLADTGAHEEALLFYYIASQITPDKHIFTGIGNEQIHLCSNNNSALDAYNHVLDTFDPAHIHAINGKGNFYTNQAIIQTQSNAPNDMIESTAKLAADNYNQALILDSTNINAFNGLGTVKIILEKYKDSITYFSDSLNQDDSRITTINGMAFAQLQNGNISTPECDDRQFVAGDCGAIQYYENITNNLDENNFNALSGLLFIYLQTENQERINEMINRLQQLEDAAAESLLEDVLRLLDSGSPDEIKEFFDKIGVGSGR